MVFCFFFVVEGEGVVIVLFWEVVGEVFIILVFGFGFFFIWESTCFILICLWFLGDGVCDVCLNLGF